MKRLTLVSLIALALVGCASTATPTALGPPPTPVLSTRAAPRVVPIPRPVKRVEPAPAAPRRTLPPVTIVIDAGHGGKDPGAVGVGPMHEKHVNLNVARLVMQQLEQRGARVVATRLADRFIELDDRAALADRQRADLFVSIHADASLRSLVTGATVYIARGAAEASRSAGREISASFERAGIRCRGVREAGYRVLVGHSRPAVLVECGFLTNPIEARRLATSSYQQQIAAAIVDGIERHFTR